MLWLLTMMTGGAMAEPSWAGLRGTAETLDAGEAVVRLPTGRTSLGVTDRTELWLTPFDLLVGGTRVGIERRMLDVGDLSWSLTPSAAEQWTLQKTALQLDSTVSWTRGRHRVNLTGSVDLRLMRRAQLGEDVVHDWSVDRLMAPLTLAYDHTRGDTVLRGQLMVPVWDEGETANFGVLSGAVIHRFGRFHLDAGAGLLVGRPSEHLFLGTYEHLLVAAYPKVDLWLQL